MGTFPQLPRVFKLPNGTDIMRRFATRSSKTPQRRWSHCDALLALAIFVALAAPGTASALHRARPPPPPHPAMALPRRLLWNPMFRPSHDSLLRQNEEIDRLDLPRIQDDAQLEALKASGELVPIEASESLKIEPQSRSLAPLLPSLDPRFRRRPFRSLLPPVPRANPGKLRRPHRQGAEEASPPQSQRGSGGRRHRVFSSCRHHGRSSAPRHDDRADALRRTLLVLSEGARIWSNPKKSAATGAST